DSYGAGGGNLSIEIKAALQEAGINAPVLSRVYGLSGRDFYVDDATAMLEEGFKFLGGNTRRFDYFGIYEGSGDTKHSQFFAPITETSSRPGITTANLNPQTGKMDVTIGTPAELTAMPKRLAPGHGACPGCGIPVNVNLLLKGIEGNVVLLFHTGCGMVVTTPYPKTAFRVPYIHNLFQSGAATLSGLVEVFHQRQRRGEIPEGDITFIMISGDGGMDIGMGPSIGTALRNHCLIMFEYDNGGYMNTGYQLSYATPMGARSSTSHVGKAQSGKAGFHKDTPQIMAGTNIPYIATVSEHNPADFVRKAAKAAEYSRRYGTAYMKSLSACPLNWGDVPANEAAVIEAAVNCCYHPLYEIENGITTLTYNPEEKGKKIPVLDWFDMMGRTRHLTKPDNADMLAQIQHEVDRRWQRLQARHDSAVL
ncbi:MAG: thiamine pyrophosphate-dependent enzyme, partial [Defluviitaleaceae bacterium]|nr:thiamine pyrophosphate-dependent enzyme [Defluviitaleaceae bacterium]